MKSTKQFIFLNILIFLSSAIGITYFYISNHLLSDFSEIQAKSIIDIFLQIGCVGALIPAIFFMLISLSIKKIANKATVYLVVIILFVLLIIAVYQFIMYMTFHEFASPIQFERISY